MRYFYYVRTRYRRRRTTARTEQTEQSRQSEPSTPEQAWGVLGAIGKLTDLNSKGKNYGDRNTFGDKLDSVPPSVAAHFPKTDPDSQSVDQSFYLTHMIGRDKGVVGMATFDQHERRDANLTYATHVNYHVITDDGQNYRLERHVTNTEHGPHMVGRDRGKPPEQMLSELTALKARVEEARPIEEASGLLTVNADEAGAINNLLGEKLKAAETGKSSPDESTPPNSG